MPEHSAPEGSIEPGPAGNVCPERSRLRSGSLVRLHHESVFTPMSAFGQRQSLLQRLT